MEEATVPDRNALMFTWSRVDHELIAGEPWAEEGLALMEKAAGQGHAYAMEALAGIHYKRNETDQAVGKGITLVH